MKFYLLFFAFFIDMNCINVSYNKFGTLQQYMLLLYPEIQINEFMCKNIDKLAKPQQKIINHKIISTYKSIECDQNILHLLYLYKNNNWKDKIHKLIKSNTIRQIKYQVTYKASDSPKTQNIPVVKIIINTNNINDISLTLPYQISPYITLVKSEIVEDITSTLNLTSQEEEKLINILENDITIKYLLFLLDNFILIYENYFIIFSPLDGKRCTPQQSKEILISQIILMLYEKIYKMLF